MKINNENVMVLGTSSLPQAVGELFMACGRKEEVSPKTIALPPKKKNEND